MGLDLDLEMDKLAQLVALRAHRKLGRKPSLRLVDAVRQPEPLASAEPPPFPSEVGYQPIDVSPRAIAEAAIMDIANRYSWHSAITHFLRTKGVPYLSDLTQPQLDDLLDRMHGYVDAAEMGASLPDCLPAS